MSLRNDIQAAYRVALESSARSPLHYLQHVTIDAKPAPKPYRELAEPWQWALAQRLSPCFSAVAGVAHKPELLNYWLTLPKGHDKSSLIGRLASWALAFTQVPFNGYVAAADKEQAGYLAEAMQVETSLNPWLRTRLKFSNWRVEGMCNSRMTILAADASGSQGIRPDIIIFDEIVHCAKPDLFHHILSGAEKRQAIVIVITNAGVKFSWQWDAKEQARQSPFWYVYEAPGPMASWMSQARIADLSKMIPRQEARRLYQNEWVDPGEVDGYLTREEIEKGAALGRELKLNYSLTPEVGVRYVAAIDYGEVKDRTVLALLHMRPDNIIVVDRLDVLQGGRGDPVQISVVERWLDEVRKTFPLDAVVIDPHQMKSTIQRFTGLVPIEEWQPRGGKANYEMACAFRSALVNGMLAWYPGCGELAVKDPTLGVQVMEMLEDELQMLQLKPMAYGFRVDHLYNRHDDRFVALAMAVVHLVETAKKKRLPEGEGWF